MQFLNPIMLVGGVAVAVPILIHLLNRRKFRKVVWGAMRFLRVSVEQNRRRMRLEDLLLLLLRCLLLLLLSLALARPTVESEAGDLFGQSRVTAAVILDNSYSMGMSDGVETRFSKARAAAEQAVESMPAGSAVAVLLASDVVRASIAEPTFDLNLARQVIREAPLTDRGTDLFPALQMAVRTLLRQPAARKELYLVTDGQAAGWRQLTEIHRLLGTVRNDLAASVVLATDEEERNLGVSELRLAGGLSPVGEPIRFEIKVTNYGAEEEKDVPVSLAVGEEPPSDAFTLPSLPAGATRHVSLFAKLDRAGYHAVTARVPEDRLPADDRRVLAVRAVNRVQVLLVDGEPGREARESETFFLRHAFSPVPPELAGEYFIQTKVVSGREFSQVRLDDYDAIVLANVGDVPEGMLPGVESYVRRGGGLIVFPGERVDREFYNEQLFRRSQLLPAALGSVQGDAGQAEVYVTFQAQHYAHPIVELWNDPASGSLGSARFFRRYELRPPDESVPGTREAAEVREAGEPRLILRYADGGAAVMERDWGLGRVVLFSSTADTAWNDLPVRLAFVPLLHRTLGAILARQDEALNLRVGAKFSRRVGMEFLDQHAIFTRPGQRDLLRDLRRIELVDGWPMLRYEETDRAGFYGVSVVEPPLSLNFAAQPDPSESDLARVSATELEWMGEVAQVVSWDGEHSLRRLAERQRSGTELWLPLVLLALVLAGAETFLGQWFSRAK